MLVISRKLGESLIIGDNIEIFINEISSDKVKVGINAPKDVKIIRHELVDIKNMNIEAAENSNIVSIKSLSAALKNNKK